VPLQPYRVHDDVKDNCEGKQRCRLEIKRDSQNGDCSAGKDNSKYKCFGARDGATRDWAHGGAAHHGIDIGVAPHVEHTAGASSCGGCKDCNTSQEWIEVPRCSHQANACSEHSEQHDTTFY
jgi:hypothetical protein